MSGQPNINITNKGCGSGCSDSCATILVLGAIVAGIGAAAKHWQIVVPALIVLIVGGLWLRQWLLQRAAAGQAETFEPAQVAQPQWKACPDCAETVLADANVCRYCGYRWA